MQTGDAAAFVGVDDLMRWTRRPTAVTDDIRAVLVANPGDDSSMAADALAAVVDDTDDRERSGIESSMSRLWSVYKLPGGVRAARNPNFNPREFAASSDTLYVAVPAERAAIYAPSVVALLEAVRFAQYKRYADLHAAGKSCTPMTFVLDEVANTAPIDLPSIASEAGGQGLHVIAAVQDLAQARHRWGSDRGAGLLTIFGTKVLLPGIIDPGTIDAVSAAIGDRRRGRLSTSTGPDGRVSTTVSPERERAVPPSAIARLEPGRVLVVTGAEPQEIAGARWHAEPARIMEAIR